MGHERDIDDGRDIGGGRGTDGQRVRLSLDPHVSPYLPLPPDVP